MPTFRKDSRPAGQRALHSLSQIVTAYDTWEGHRDECYGCQESQFCTDEDSYWQDLQHELGRARGLLFALTRAPVKEKRSRSFITKE